MFESRTAHHFLLCMGRLRAATNKKDLPVASRSGICSSPELLGADRNEFALIGHQRLFHMRTRQFPAGMFLVPDLD